MRLASLVKSGAIISLHIHLLCLMEDDKRSFSEFVCDYDSEGRLFRKRKWKSELFVPNQRSMQAANDYVLRFIKWTRLSRAARQKSTISIVNKRIPAIIRRDCAKPKLTETMQMQATINMVMLAIRKPLRYLVVGYGSSKRFFLICISGASFLLVFITLPFDSNNMLSTAAMTE